MIWFSADWHLGHAGIRTHQPVRGIKFADVADMDTQMIDQINSVCRRNDTLFFLGDFCWQASRAGHYRQRLNVRNFRVCQGNHDAASLRNHASTFDHMLFCRLCNRWGTAYKFHMCHYPLMSWQGLHYGSIHLYGHSHGRYESVLDELHPGRRAMDIGIDVAYEKFGMWRPFNIDEVVDMLVGDEEATLSHEDKLEGPRTV